MSRKSRERSMKAYFINGPVHKDADEYRPSENLKYSLKHSRHVDGQAVHYLQQQIDNPSKDSLIGVASSKLQQHCHEIAAIAIGIGKPTGCVILITEPLYPETAIRAINTIIYEFWYRMLLHQGSKFEDVFVGFQCADDPNISKIQERVLAALEKEGCLPWDEPVDLPSLQLEGVAFDPSYYAPLKFMLVDKQAVLRAGEQCLVLEAMNARAYQLRKHPAFIEELDEKLPLAKFRSNTWKTLSSKPVATSAKWLANNFLGIFGDKRD